MNSEREEQLLLEIEELKQTIIEKDSIIDTLTTNIKDALYSMKDVLNHLT